MGSVTSNQQPLIVAVCGDSGSGKTTLTDGMVQVFGQERVAHICLDDYHILDRATRLRTGITALHPAANNIALMTEHIRCLAHGESIIKPVYDHKTGTFGKPEVLRPADIIIVHGLHPLYSEELRNLAQVHIYLDPEIALLQQWKIMRDSTVRGYTVEQVRQQMVIRRRDSRLFIQPQKQFADIIIRFSRGSLYYRTRDLAHLDVLEIDGTISHQKACELEDVIWAHMDNVSHLRPDRLSQLGLFYAGNILRQSDPLALTQLIILYHVVNKMHEAASEETL